MYIQSISHYCYLLQRKKLRCSGRVRSHIQSYRARVCLVELCFKTRFTWVPWLTCVYMFKHVLGYLVLGCRHVTVVAFFTFYAAHMYN